MSKFDDSEMIYEPGLELLRTDFKTALEFRRQTVRLTQKKLSEKSGVNLRTIQDYEQGKRDINKVAGITLYKLAQALECKIEDLLEISYEMRYGKKEPDKIMTFKEMLGE